MESSLPFGEEPQQVLKGFLTSLSTAKAICNTAVNPQIRPGIERAVKGFLFISIGWDLTVTIWNSLHFILCSVHTVFSYPS